MSNPVHLKPKKMPEISFYSAGRHPKLYWGNTRVFSNRNDPTTLRITGVVVDEIVDLLPMSDWKSPFKIDVAGNNETYLPDEARQTSYKLLTQIQSLAGEAFCRAKNLGPSQFNNIAETLAGFARTKHIPKDWRCQPSFSRLVGSQHKPIDIWWDEFHSLEIDEHESDHWFLNQMDKIWRRRSFFTTKNGSIGACSELAEQGDKVVILFGGLSAYVMRKREDGVSWKFLHAAYLHGVMSGQVFDILDRGELKEEVFVIQ